MNIADTMDAALQQEFFAAFAFDKFKKLNFYNG